MKRKWYVLLIMNLVVVGCSSTGEIDPTSLQTSTKTPKGIYLTNTHTKSSTITKTITIPVCDPELLDYCIEDGTFILQVPIEETRTNTIDRSYAYGSTSGDTRIPHLGVEFYNPSGTPVLAAGNGIVVYTGNDESSQFGPFANYYGNLVIIQHNLGEEEIYSLYAHLSKISTIIGKTITQGETIGEVGSSGSSIGSHLHFELRRDYKDFTTSFNPELWLKPILDTGVLAMRFQDKGGNMLNIATNIQFYTDRTGVFVSAWQPEPYSPDLVHEESWENVTLGNLPSGFYRISYYWGGILYERWVEIMSNKVTLVFFLLP